jgi:hypothetical protein
MTRREIFETVKNHLLTQGKKAWVFQDDPDQPGPCLYRTDDGLRCAVGCLIPDELYDPRMEGVGIDCLGTDWSLPMWRDGRYERSRTAAPLLRTALESRLGREVATKDLELLRELQVIHDEHERSVWEKKLREVEEDEDLRTLLD